MFVLCWKNIMVYIPIVRKSWQTITFLNLNLTRPPMMFREGEARQVDTTTESMLRSNKTLSFFLFLSYDSQIIKKYRALPILQKHDFSCLASLMVPVVYMLLPLVGLDWPWSHAMNSFRVNKYRVGTDARTHNFTPQHPAPRTSRAPYFLQCLLVLQCLTDPV